ncbi:chromosome partitioning protein ParA, partial [Vibrio parahaemolyticus]
YKSKKITYDSLTTQIAIFSEDIELIELGFYEPKFDFDASETFKEEIKKCKECQKTLLREKSSSGAIHCYREWTVDG